MSQQERAAQLLAAVQHPEGGGDRSSVAERLLVLGCSGLPVSGAGLSWATATGATGVVAATEDLDEEIGRLLGVVAAQARVGRHVVEAAQRSGVAAVEVAGQHLLLVRGRAPVEGGDLAPREA